MKRIDPFVSWLVGLICGTPLAVAAIGAVSARPISDDYSLIARVGTEGFVGAFSDYIHNQSPTYSMIGFQTGGTALLGKNFIPVACCGLLILIVIVAGVVWRTWSTGASSVPTAVAAVALSTGMVGSFASIHYPKAPILFGALLWVTSWVPHLVPMLLAPLVLLLALKVRGRLGVAASIMAGLATAGFGFAETATIVSMVVMTGWALWRLGGPRRLQGSLAPLIGLGAGLVVGAVIVYVLPGTASRNQAFATSGLGLAQAHGHVISYFASLAFGNFEAAVLSPAIPLGLILGVVLGALSPRDPFRTRTAVIWCAVVTVVAWLAVSIGDLFSYQVFWHVYPLFMMLYLTAGAVGWRLGEIRPSFAGIGAVLGAGCLVWTVLLTTAVTSAALDRRPIVDGDFARAAALDRRPVVDRATTHLVWVSMSVGQGYYIGDAESIWWPAEDHWITGAISLFFAIPERNIVVKIVRTPNATVRF